MNAERLSMLIFLFVLGCYLGRLINRCAVRIPQKFYLVETFWHVIGRYPLPFTGLKTSWYHFLPIFGTMTMPGWSPISGRHIKKREPWIEIINGILLVALYLIEVPASLKYMDSGLYSAYMPTKLLIPGIQNPDMLQIRYFYHLVLVEFLLMATLIDYDLFIIPDSITVPPMVIGLVGALTGLPLFLVPIWFQDADAMRMLSEILPANMLPIQKTAVPEWIIQQSWLHSLLHSLAGFIVGGGAIWIVRIIGFMVLRQEAMGFGDVILMAMVGIFIGWQPVIVAIFLGALTATLGVLVILPFLSRSVIPFGPFLSLGTLLLLFFWQQIWPTAEKYFDLGMIAPVLLILMAFMLYLCLQLLQFVKSLLGMSMQYVLPWSETGWTRGDHLAYYSAENVDTQQGKWKHQHWPGELAGRGQLQEQRWKNSGR